MKTFIFNDFNAKVWIANPEKDYSCILVFPCLR